MLKKFDRVIYQRLLPFIYHIPGDNPSSFTLAGTNSFVIGNHNKRLLFEAGDFPENCESKYAENFSLFLNDFPEVQIDKIILSHGEHDHMGGLDTILQVMKDHK